MATQPIGKRSRVTATGRPVTYKSNYQKSHLCSITPSRQANVSRLVGKRCMVSCMIDGTKTQALWDTGAQVTIIPADWRATHLPQAKLRPLCELLGGTDLNLTAANGSPIPYDGWLNVSFSLMTGLNHEIRVPVLVTRATSGVPIIGYNVIEEIVQRDTLHSTPTQAVRAAFPSMTRRAVTVRKTNISFTHRLTHDPP